MATGRIKIFLGGLAIGVALPWNFWEVLDETGSDPEKATLLLSIGALAIIAYLGYSGLKKLFGGE